MPAADCYAGEAWDGPPVFDHFFASIEDRGLVLPFKKWPNYARKKTTKNLWKIFLRWVGVSWEPKIRRVGIPRPENNDWKAIGHWSQMPWKPEFKFVKYLEVSNLKNRCRYSDGSYYGADWEIEYFSEFIREANDSDKSASIIRRVISLAKSIKQKRATYYKPYNQSVPKYPQKYDNFADYQLLHEKWLPCKPTLFHRYQRVAPQDAFLPGKGLKNLFPEVDRRGIKDEEWFRHIMLVLRDNLAVQDELPEDPEDWHEWMRELQKLANLLDDDCQALLPNAAKSLYRKYLKLNWEWYNSDFPAGIDVPCMCWANDNEVLTFLPPAEVFYIDQPYFDEVRQKIESKGFKLFIVSLNAGKKAPEKLGVRFLSDELRAKPDYITDKKSDSDKLSRRYKERRLGLNLTAKLRKSLPEELNIVAVHSLRLALTSNSQCVTDVEVLSWKTEDGLLLINLDKDKWRALGHGLAVRIAMAEDKASLFENLLREDDKDVYLDRLRQEGVTEDDIKDAESAWTISTGSTPEPESPQESGPNTELDLAEKEGLEEKPKDSFSQVERLKKDSERRENVETISTEQKPPQGSKSGSKPNMETGQAAENWIEKKLKQVFPNRVRRRVRDEEKRESDFVVSANSREFHIEVKHVQKLPGTIFWTGHECKKAQDLERSDNKYIMAILSPKGDGAYKIHWIWRPLDELKRASREVQWTGDSGYKSVDTDSWDITERWPNKVPTKRYDFRIKLNDRVVERFKEDTEGLNVLCRKIGNLKAGREIE